jgi:hypothetical protein
VHQSAADATVGSVVRLVAYQHQSQKGWRVQGDSFPWYLYVSMWNEYSNQRYVHKSAEIRSPENAVPETEGLFITNSKR